MKVFSVLTLLVALPGFAFGAGRADSAVRVGAIRSAQAGARMAGKAVNSSGETNAGTATTQSVAAESSDAADCRDAYRECMDNFCLLDESQGERCACSDNINRAKSKLKEVLDIQAEADKLFTEGVEREQLGAKARLVFSESTAGNS